MGHLFIGLMSGTSLDGADALLADFSAGAIRTLATAHRPFPDELRDRLLVLSSPGEDFLEAAAECSAVLADVYAGTVADVLDSANLQASAIEAIGCHGQTVRHRPERGFTIQLNDPARIAERTGIDVVADFRRRDLAAGGQGAPLVPVFHDALFRHGTLHRAIVNIGGISNVTSLKPGQPPIGFDCGPGNVLMDGWIRSSRGLPYDEGGQWAAEGSVDGSLLRTMLDEPYFHRDPPKSTGRELFNADWLAGKLGRESPAADVQATLLELTAATIVDAVEGHCQGAREIYLCGGGARNARLASRIRELASPRHVALTDELGVPTGQVEPAAFGWLAMKCVRREPVDLRAVTGAAHPCVLGAIYPA